MKSPRIHHEHLIGLTLVVLTSLLVLLGYFWNRPLSDLANRATSSGAAHQPVSTPAQLQPDQTNQARVSEAYGKLPLSFEVNHGQTDSEVQFISRGSGYNLFLTGNEAVIALRKNEDSQTATRHPESAVLRMKLVGANPQPQVAGLEELPGKVNYFIGNDPQKWRIDIPTYARVKYQNVYPGVDLVYYGNQRQLEYDFIIAPGTDPKDITLGFEGIERLEVNTQGDLVLHTSNGQVRQHKPTIYQEIDGIRREISGGYVLKSNSQVGFQLALYDPDKPLIVDPVLIYSTYLGGSSWDGGNSIAVDVAGNAYVTGFANSIDFPTVNSLQSGGGWLAFVAKLNAGGSALIYSTYLGGGGDTSSAIAVDHSGNAYIVGLAQSSNFPTVNPLQPSLRGTADAFVAKLNATGSALIYSTYLGGSNQEFGYSITLDASESVYITGYSTSADFPTVNPLQPALKGGRNAFVAKLNANGSSLVYSTYLGGTNGDEIGKGIAVDNLGSAYVTGFTEAANFPTVNPLQPLISGERDAFIAKLSATGSALIYSTYLGGGNRDVGIGITVDATGNAYVTGFTISTNFPTMNALQPFLSCGPCGPDAFVAKLNANGSSLVYSTYLGGYGEDIGFGIAVDSSGNAYVTGDTQAANFTTVNPLQAILKGTQDAFVAKLSANGSSLIFSTYLGGNGNDGRSFDETSQRIAVDSSGNVYVTGQTISADFPTVNPLQSAFSGITDAFVVKLSQPVNQPPVVTITGPPSGAIYSVGAPVNFMGTFTDNSGDTHTATWMFDLITQPGTVNEITGDVTATYTFTVAGVYAVTLSVSDGSGTGTADTVDGLTAMVVVYDPNGGFVTGGGWINSPAGAYVPNPLLTGKANFGFVSKYQNGASVPTGNTEFQFKAGNLNFKSTSYGWMVISGGKKAQYKGFGTINGSGNYRFMLTAIDGDQPGGGGQDKFRIKIWSDGGGLVYDNQMNDPDSNDPTTVLGGGSIVIHKP